jgi:hypothetical protein
MHWPEPEQSLSSAPDRPPWRDPPGPPIRRLRKNLEISRRDSPEFWQRATISLLLTAERSRFILKSGINVR